MRKSSSPDVFNLNRLKEKLLFLEEEEYLINLVTYILIMLENWKIVMG